MIIISLDSNIESIIASFKAEIDKTIDQIRDGMFEGVRQFEGAAIKQYYTGRKGVVGLNRRTGTLARGWLVKSITSFEDFIVQLGNKVKYGSTWEFGRSTNNAFGRGIHAFYSKRTDVTGKFKKEGYNYLNKAIFKRFQNQLKVMYR